MSKFISDIFSEETSTGAGKYSAKRFMGITTGLLAAVGAVVSGLHFYDVPEGILNSMWIYSGAMLGVSVLKGLGKSS